ncbi:hypothetical protein D3C78_1006590 [compost metagenome]
MGKELNLVSILSLDAGQDSQVIPKGFTILPYSTRPYKDVVLLYYKLFSLPDSLLINLNAILIVDVVHLVLPSEVDIVRVVASTTCHGETTSVTNRSKLGGFLRDSLTAIFCVCVLRYYQVVSYNDISVPPSGVSS